MDFDTYTSPDAEQLLRAASARWTTGLADRRLFLTEAAGAAVFLAVAIPLAVLAPSARPLSLTSLAAVVITYLAAAKVRVPVGAGWTRPTQVAFVPMLFLLPTAIVPLLVAACLVAELFLPRRRDGVSATRVLTMLGDSMYSLGPVLVLVLAHAEGFSWLHWPLYLLAAVAEIAFDAGSYAARSWLTERLVPFEAQVLWTYLTDLCLSCAGLLIAASAVGHSGLILLALPLIVLFGLFARERTERMEGTLALSTAYRGTALLLGDVLEDDDEYTGIHSRQVVDLALAVAARLGLDPTTKRNVEFGALLHDVGKIRVPKDIIQKPGKLSDAEWAIMREHTIFGEQMLRQVGGTLSSVGRVVRHSHERYDGTGYPDGLVGDQIPIEARVVCACDAFNAMTTNRPYRRARTIVDAMGELRRCSGTHFDPLVIQALLAVITDEPLLVSLPRVVPMDSPLAPVAAGF